MKSAALVGAPWRWAWSVHVHLEQADGGLRAGFPDRGTDPLAPQSIEERRIVFAARRESAWAKAFCRPFCSRLRHNHPVRDQSAFALAATS